MSVAIDAGIVDQLLGVPPGRATWAAAAAATRRKVLATWLSAQAAQGGRLTDADLEYLARMRRRVASLHALGEDLTRVHRVRVLKGPRIAAHYPAGLLRQSGDVDLVAPDLPALWACALDLRDRHDAVPESISVLDGGAGGVHVGVSMKWPAEEPHLDKPMGADITTCAFCGDFKGVPVRVHPPDEEDLAGLFAVAEERFQRKYRLKDLLDFLVLAPVLEDRLGDALADTVCAHADQLALAPELLSLARKAGSWTESSPRWQDTVKALEPLAADEKQRRVPDRPGMHRLRYGLPLNSDADVGSGTRSRTGADTRSLELAVVHRDDLELLPTPLGTCLLLSEPVLTEETWARADAHARALASVDHHG